MIFFAFTLVLMFSLAAVLYLMVHALPRIAEEPGDEPRGFLDRWSRSELPEKIDAWFNGFLLKFLRKFKIVTLKIDNNITSRLHKIHREKNGKKPIDFKEIVDGKDE